MKAFIRGALTAVALVTILVGLLGWVWISSHRFSARAAPGRLDAFVTRQLHRLAIERETRRQTNPLSPTPDVVREGLVRFAEDCAVCHANDGGGDTAVGQGLYPQTPDLRLSATQSRTDGELFTIVENGVRFTGMPGRSTGTPEGERASWELVHFVRHLPVLTTGELALMGQLSPTPPREIRREIQQELEEERSRLAPTP